MTQYSVNRRDLDDILMSDQVEEKLENLQQNGTLAEVFPEVQAMVGFGGGKTGHKDLWRHTKLVVAQCPPRLSLRWAALFHDTGKVKVFKHIEKVTFNQHEQASARIFHDAALRTRMFPSDFRREVSFLIGNLGYVEGYEPAWTDSAVRRLAKDLGSHLPDLLDLARADTTSKHEAKRDANRRTVQELEDRVARIAQQDAIPAPLPKGLGDAVCVAFGIQPSRALGDLMNLLREAVEAGKLPRQAPFEVYLEHLKKTLVLENS